MGEVIGLPLAKRKRAGTVERDVTVGMVVSDAFLKRVRPHWDASWHQSDLCRLVAGWCVEHWDRYARAPGRDVEKRWQDWAPGADEAEAEDVATMLDLASRERETGAELNVDYLVDRAEGWARKQVLSRLTREADQANEEDRTDEAEAILQAQLPRFGGRSSWTEPEDREAMGRAFNQAYEPLLNVPGAFGEFLNPQTYREGFVAFMAPEKRGKTALLLEISKWAVRSRRNVAYFAVGDMSEEQLLLRWASMLTGMPDDGRFAGKKRKVPHLEWDGGAPIVEWREETVLPLTLERAVDVVERFGKKFGAGRIRFQAWPNFQASVDVLDRELDAWQVAGWNPDLIVTDYADNLVPSDRDDYRHRVNKVWQGLRSQAQRRKALALTVTQTDAGAYGKKNITAGNYSEDKRKYAHVTAMGVINQDEGEAEKGILRLAWTEFVRRSPTRRHVCLLTDLSRNRVLADPRWSWWDRWKKPEKKPEKEEEER